MCFAPDDALPAAWAKPANTTPDEGAPRRPGESPGTNSQLGVFMEVYSWTKIANAIISCGWGRRAESEDDAIRSMTAEERSAAASLALLQGLNRMADAFARFNPIEKRGNQSAVGWADDSAKVFPGIFVGDRLYAADIECGLLEAVVLVVDEANHAYVATSRQYGKPTKHIHNFWASEWYHKTPMEAWRHELQDSYEAKKEAKRIEVAKVIELGGDLSQFDTIEYSD